MDLVRSGTLKALISIKYTWTVYLIFLCECMINS